MSFPSQDLTGVDPVIQFSEILLFDRDLNQAAKRGEWTHSRQLSPMLA
jgi:hypothetical protein